MIEIDGSYGEGGGQIVRTALALSTITQKPFRVINIRKGRKQPGLKAQHVTAVKALQQICGAKTSEVELGATELTYTPGKIKGGKFSFDIGTAGSITLLLQAILPPLLFAPKKVTITITGGTAGKWQAPVEYFQHVLLPNIQRFCKSIDCRILKRGYFPKGGGQVVVEVTPLKSLKEVTPINLVERGELVQIKGVSHAAQILAMRKVSERQAQAAEMLLKKYDVPLDIQTEYQETLCAGSGILVWARFAADDEPSTVLGADGLGERGVLAEDVGKQAAKQLIKEIDSGAAADKHLGDQLLPFMALLPGSTIVASEISQHSKTNMWVIEKFLPVKFSVDGNKISVT